MTITNHEHFTLTDLSVTAQVERIKAAGAQAIVAGSSGTGFGTILRGMRDAGLDVPVASSGANLSYKLMEGFASVMPREVDVMGFPAYARDAVNVPAVRRAVDQMTEAMRLQNNNLKPEIGGVIAWDAAFVMVDALRKKGVNATAA